MESRVIRRAAIENLGCKVNQAEMDAVRRLLRSRGVGIVEADEDADLVVINTCTVTSPADQKSRQILRRARRSSPEARIVVTGCSVAVDAELLAGADPGAMLFDNEAKASGRLLAELAALLDASGAPEAGSDLAASGREDDEAADRTRAFVKIQDGCSFHCTYCVIPRARGAELSMPACEVVAEVRAAVAAGRREVVLTGINAGTYDGRAGAESARQPEEAPATTLAGLVRRLLAETAVERIRLSSIEPQHVTDELLDVWRGSPERCLPHFHLPLQSGDDAILRLMGRRYDTAFYAGVVARVRRTIPGVAIHADLIVGFPGEDDAAWARTVEFVRSLDLAGLHVFRYSERPGTPAGRMAGHVAAQAMKRRAAEGLALAAEAGARFAVAQLGKELRVLIERPRVDGEWVGHAENHVPVRLTGEWPRAAVAFAAGTAGPVSLQNSIATVRAEAVDPVAPDRILGRLLALDPPISGLFREPLAQSARK